MYMCLCVFEHVIGGTCICVCVGVNLEGLLVGKV